jgi:hypothetical protein
MASMVGTQSIISTQTHNLNHVVSRYSYGLMHFSFWIIIYLVTWQHQKHKWSASCLVSMNYIKYIVYKRHHCIHIPIGQMQMIFYVLEDFKNCNDTHGTHRHKPYADNLVDYYTRKT